MIKEEKKNQIIIYNTEDGQSKIEVRMKDETVWLSQKQMAELFDCSTDNISLHLRNVYTEGELEENLTTEDSSVVQKEGYRDVRRPVKLYNLDAIISVGYRINSLRGTQFRIWATQKLKEYIIKGFVMDDERLAEGWVKICLFFKKTIHLLVNGGAPNFYFTNNSAIGFSVLAVAHGFFKH